MSYIMILQIIIAIIFAMVGLMKLMTPKEKLAMKMGWVNNFSSGQVKLIGLLEIFGALGLVLPLWVEIHELLAPVSAAALALLMAGALGTHIKRNEKKELVMPLILFLSSIYIAISLFY